MNLYGNYMLSDHQNIFMPLEIIYEYEVKDYDQL